MIKIIKLYESKNPDVEQLKKAISNFLLYGTKPESNTFALHNISDILFFGALLDSFSSLSISPWGSSDDKKWYVLDEWGFSDDMLDDMELMADNLSNSIKRFKTYRKPTDQDFEQRKSEREQYLLSINWERNNLKKLLEEK